MTLDYKLCDICEIKIPKDLRCFVATGMEHNGIENEIVGEDVELCAGCAAKMIGQLANSDHDYMIGKKVVGWVKRHKQQRKG